MSDSVRGTLSWVNSGPVRSKCQENTTSAGDEHESVKGKGREMVRRLQRVMPF